MIKEKIHVQKPPVKQMPFDPEEGPEGYTGTG
jgi:hypothetical protein